MTDAHKVCEALLETVEVMADTNDVLEPLEVEFGKITNSLPPNAAAFSQRSMPVTIDGERYCVVAYKIAK